MPRAGSRLKKRALRHLVGIVVLTVFVGAAHAADFSDFFATDVTTTGTDTYLVEARGNRQLPEDLLKKAAFLKAAEVTLDSGAYGFRILKAMRRTITSRRGSRAKSFAIYLDIETRQAGEPPPKGEKWYPARRVVKGLEAKLKAALEKIESQAR